MLIIKKDVKSYRITFIANALISLYGKSHSFILNSSTLNKNKANTGLEMFAITAEHRKNLARTIRHYLLSSLSQKGARIHQNIKPENFKIS